MYKKIFSAILFGVLTIASTSTFVSCKDYDDDIKDLQAQIAVNDEDNKALHSALEALKTETSNLKAQLEQKEGELKALIASAQSAADAAQSAIDTEIIRAKAAEAALQARIEACENTEKELKALIEAVDAKKVNKTDFDKAVEDIYAKLTAIDDNLGKALTEIESLKNGLKNEETARKAAIEDLQNQITALDKFAKELEKTEQQDKAALLEQISKVREDLDKAIEDLKKTQEDVTEVLPKRMQSLEESVSNINAQLVTLNVLISRSLRSLVFEPESYYQGIQAFDIATYNYKAKSVQVVNANGKFQNDAPTIGSEVSFTPDLTAKYYMNPSKADVSEDAEHYAFVGYDMPYTRARTNTSSSFNIYKAIVKDGMVTVKANYKGNGIKDIEKDNEVSVVALQYNSGDTIITSDFAAIRANKYTDFHLNLTTKAEGVTTHNKPYAIPSHMYEKAADAIANNAQINVAWNSEGIDLREYVQSCRSYETYSSTTETVDQIWDSNAKAGKVEEAGFKYSFELVGYETGESDTKQSAHAAINENGYTLRPQMPNAGKQAEYGFTQNRAEIGREPLVRVLLTDTVHKKNVAVGYVKLAIVSEGETPTDETADYLDIVVQNWAYTICCGDGEFKKLVLTWDQIEDQILAKLNMPKAYFHEMYSLEGVVNGGDPATQYNGVLTTSTPVTTPFGKVTITTDSEDGAATDTKVLTWIISNQEAYLAQKSGSPVKKTAIVCFRPTSGKTPTPTYFYVRFTWEPSAVNLKPSTAFGDQNKIQQYWYADNSGNAGSGYKEIHGSVETVGTDVEILNNGTLNKIDSYATDEFVFDIRNTLVGHKLSLDALKTPYAGLNSSVKNTFIFVSANGLTAKADGTELWKGNELVATIDPQTGVIRYEHSNASHELLNAADHKDLANSVTATVNVKSVACDGWATGVADIPVTVENKEFNVKFLRPIDVTDGQAHFVDAATGGDKADVELTFIDWRDHNFLSSQTNGYDYFTYYGVKKIDLKLNEATTNLNGSWTKLKTIAPNFKLEYTAPTYYPAVADPKGYTRTGSFVKAKQYGTLHYDNNGSTMGDAQVKIPVEVTYDWGVVKAEVICSFDKTQNNVKKQ